ncbi:MAG: response regulator transcription factor [Elusimicrobia bacterium]|nr:response regulator transcription factor [Elusimicrobiota bacterium]
MHPRRVLVVDDEDSQRRLYCRLLESHGLESAQAESGAKALESIRRERPKLIVADISMPGMDGIQLYKALHRAQETANIPVLLMTGIPAPRSLLREAGIALGIDEIFVKGDDVRRFIGLVAKLLRAPGATSSQKVPAEKQERVTIDTTHRRIWVDGLELPKLPSKRYDLLIQLLNGNGPRSLGDLLHSVWPESDNVNIVGVGIMRLRRDLTAFPNIRIETTAYGYAARLAP